MTETARAMRKAEDRKEYDDLLAVMASSRPYAFTEFNALAHRMRRPFHCVLEGREVCVTESDAAIMLEGSALKAIGELLVSNKRQADCDGCGRESNKKRNRGNEAVNTTRGANGITMLHGACGRDGRHNAKAKEKLISGLRREKKSLEVALALIEVRKADCFHLREAAETGDTLLNARGERTAVEFSAVSNYWDLTASATIPTYDIFLGLFLPDSGVLSKAKGIKWAVLLEKVVPILSKAQFDSKVEVAVRRLTEVIDELGSLEEQTIDDEEQQDDSDADDENEESNMIVDGENIYE